MIEPELNRIVFLPDGLSALVPAGTPVLEAAAKAGVFLAAPCNGRGTCGKCGVRFEQGAPAPHQQDQDFFTAGQIEQGWRLACLHHVDDPAVLYAAPANPGKVSFGPSADVALSPKIRKVLVRLESIRGESITWEELQAAAGSDLAARPGIRVVQLLATIPFRPGIELTLVVRGDRVILLEEGDTRPLNFGLALDIGTTTVAAALLDLNTGRELGQRSALNRQSIYGSDVMARLTALVEDRKLLPVLQRLVLETANQLLHGLLDEAGIERDHVYEAVVAGNSCMHHLFLGLDPLTLAFAPYDARVISALEVPAADLGLHINENAIVYALPNVASFIGGDAVAATLAAGIHRSSALRCLADIGTNGEIVLGSSGRLIACSTPAGPAFEGLSISCGMLASEGAIDSVSIGDSVVVHTICDAPARGVAGSGLIDACGQLRRSGILAENGRIRAAAEIAGLSPTVARQILPEGFLLARGLGNNIVLSQKDVRELQLAKGVIFASIETLKSEMKIGNEDLADLCLAGTFGSYLRISSARDIGLVPPLPEDRIRAIGNAALAGARMCLLSTAARAEAEDLARRIEHIELPGRADFRDLFMSAMSFPAL
jgi:uncharacterized 2Fe-2S/4Fe-4S cluster protein (DUF4445 family)